MKFIYAIVLYWILASYTGAHDLTSITESALKTPPKNSNANFDRFSLQPEYRRDIVLDSSALSPFRKPEARAAQAAQSTPKSVGPNIAAVLAKFQQLGLTGVIPSTSRRAGLIILGGTIYREGQEITLAAPHNRAGIPLLPEHTVVLRSVTAQALGLAVSHAGDHGSAPQSVPVGLLEFRER